MAGLRAGLLSEIVVMSLQTLRASKIAVYGQVLKKGIPVA